jgi:hypothetical protein
MELKTIRTALEELVRVFSASGAKAQAQGTQEVADLLRDARDASVEDFVQQTKAAIDGARADSQLLSLGAELVAQRLRELDGDNSGFEALIKRLQSKSCGAQQVAAIAGLYTGAGKDGFKTKSRAIKAIVDKHRERVFQASKARLNEKVTPF